MIIARALSQKERGSGGGMLGTGDGQNQDKKAADAKKSADTKTPKTAAKNTAASSTGTVFAPAAAMPVDPLVNPYDLATDTNSQAPTSNQTTSTPPVFAEPAPANTTANTAQTAAPATQPAATAPVVSADQANDLLSIKQQALQNLTPLIDKIEQTPEDRFKTMMMLLQASDNPELVKKTYDAAQAISDEKVKAQALLDVVNEINYFTQKSQQ